MAGYDLDGARQAGVPDAEIAHALAGRLNYDLEGARKAGVPDADIVHSLVNRFNSTEGGAATGNQSIQRQGDKTIKTGRDITPIVDIGGASVLGGALGAVAPEIVSGAGRIAGAFPQTRALGTFLEGMATPLRTAGRAATAAQGAISGAAGETAGQVAEAAGAPGYAAEGARLVGGAVTPEFARGVILAAKAIPNLSIFGSKTELARKIAASMGKETKDLSEAEQRYLDEQIGMLRGGEKTDRPLGEVGAAMDQYGTNKVHAATLGVGNADSALNSIGRVAPIAPAEMADTGGRLRTAITGRNASLKAALDDQYKANEKARDAIVSANEAAGKFINKTPEFDALVNDLKSNLEAGKRSPDVQGTYKHILSQITSGGADVFGQPKPITFQALDDVRRNLGEVFRGKPPEGYAAIAAEDARKYYAKISDIQKRYAGAPQEQLLDDYARGKEGLEPFISAKGRKATALDRYDDKQFATDASTLPDAYFKNRASVQALKSLTGNDALVNRAALEYVNKKLDGASSKEVDAFMRKNSEWLAEFTLARKLIENHGGKLVEAERGVAQAADFAKQAASANSVLMGNRFPADRVRNLVQNGNAELWGVAGPAIAASPEGKANILSAVRQVLADKPMTPDTFSRQLRPALKTSGLADDAALDLIESKLRDINAMKIPEEQKLGWRRRVLLNSLGGYTASGMARGSVEAAKAVPY